MMAPLRFPAVTVVKRGEERNQFHSSAGGGRKWMPKTRPKLCGVLESIDQCPALQKTVDDLNLN